jgi:hypothetical protein
MCQKALYPRLPAVVHRSVQALALPLYMGKLSIQVKQDKMTVPQKVVLGSNHLRTRVQGHLPGSSL